MAGALQIGALEAALAANGLCLRGWVFPDAEAAPELAAGGAASAIALIGHEGGAFWRVFVAWHQTRAGAADPLDTWSKAVIAPLALRAGGEAVFPSDRPWHPFQKWAMAAGGLKPSPLGILIDPVFGLWHGYRGAILFGEAPLGVPRGMSADDVPIHRCDACVGKPCLTACPVDAFSPDGLAVSRCRAHLKTEAGQNGCMISGCMARDACPVGREHRYSDAQIRFHMTAYS
ncbi:ferredoxin [Hoeflea sp.]|uniref:ferredoxin n=1 Tax=Hoeflea sp. TaxID=1940281 RepID=UPI0019A97F80|nr:ferredoxin [Hoeflea sp.]MBC7281219.1 ferredoxin [Hoeflea sp.]